MEGEDPIWDLLDRISRTGNVFTLRAATMDAFRALGFDAAFFLAPVVLDPGVGRVVTNIGFPEEWEKRYEAEWKMIDPLPGIALSRQSAFFWPDDIAVFEMGAAGAAYLDELERFGMGRGIVVPCFGPYARCGVVGVSMPTRDDAFTERNRLRVEICARRSFQRYSRIEQPFSRLPSNLDQNEFAILRALADGKSNGEIAKVMHLPVGQLDTLMHGLLEKIGAKDYATASIRALALGMIIAGVYPQETRRERQDESGTG